MKSIMISGYLCVDRPQRSSAQHPTLHGSSLAHLLRRTRARLSACRQARRWRSVGHLCAQRTAIARNEIIVRRRVIGGLQMIDAGEADDKIVSVLENDYVWAKPATSARCLRCSSSGFSTTS